jgi:hypothetical protein
MDRESCTAFIEDTYFGNVCGGNIDSVMDCFAPDAKVIIRHGDNPERLFAVHPTAAESPLQEFYEHLCGNYDAWFGDFEHYVDTSEQRAASRFTVRLTPRPDGLYADAGPQELMNCNFFSFAGNRVHHMIIYYANPGSAFGPAPTGYPKGR